MARINLNNFLFLKDNLIAYFLYLLEEMNNEDVQKIADIIISEAIDNDFGNEKDDMTVMVAKVC